MVGRRRVLVGDDEPLVRRMIEIGLRAEGYDVVTVENGAEVLSELHNGDVDVVILDVVMPDMDGFEVCSRIRNISAVPVIMLTALRNETDIVRGLDAGADEYLTKPFSLTELSARIRALLRRVDLQEQSIIETPERVLRCDGGRLTIDFDRRTVSRDGGQVPLSDTEFKLLSCLVAHAGRVVPHERVLEQVWGSPQSGQTTYLRTYIGLLRRKIEEDPQSPRLILSSHGVGYYFQPD